MQTAEGVVYTRRLERYAASGKQNYVRGVIQREPQHCEVYESRESIEGSLKLNKAIKGCRIVFRGEREGQGRGRERREEEDKFDRSRRREAAGSCASG